MSFHQYKVVVCGAEKTGKTSFVQRFLKGDFKNVYYPTLGVEVHPLGFTTNLGNVQFNVWDCAGSDTFKGLGQGYFINAQCAIVFVDDEGEWKNYIRDLLVVKNDMPIVLVRNKIDLCVEVGWDWNPIQSDEIAKDYQRIEISAKSNCNIEKPFLYLARKFMGDNVVFVEEETVPPNPEEEVDEGALRDFEEEMNESFRCDEV